MKYGMTDLGAAITDARWKLVEKHWKGEVTDIGIGSGQFMMMRDRATGFDVCPEAIELLDSMGRWRNPYETEVEAATFWDSLEHIKEPEVILRGVSKWAFISIPIYRNRDHVLGSKHFRPDEHYHYHTHVGFVSFMWRNGFRLREFNDSECVLGRQGIMSFAFKRVTV